MDILLDKIVVNLNAIRGQERRKRFDRSIQIVRRLGFSSLFVAVIFFAGIFQKHHGLLTESKRFIEAAMRANRKQQIQQNNAGNNADDYDNQVLFVQEALIICHGSPLAHSSSLPPCNCPQYGQSCHLDPCRTAQY